MPRFDVAAVAAAAALVAVFALFTLSQPAAGAVEIAGLTHLDGKPLKAADVSEDALFVVFSTWSPKCRNIVERVNKLHADWGGRARIFLVNFQEDRAAVDEFFEGHSLEVEVLLDPDATFSKKHKITFLPSLLAIKDGNTAFGGKLPTDVTAVLQPIFE